MGRVRNLQPRVLPLPATGIDLAKRHLEVRRILFAGFGKKIHASGWDPDDVAQEVYRGILARNQGKCPFDSEKSSFAHYVHMVCECILANYGRSQRRLAAFGASLLEDGDEDLDVKDESPDALDDLIADDLLAKLLKRAGGDAPAVMAARLGRGTLKAEAAARGLSPAQAAAGVERLKQAARELMAA